MSHVDEGTLHALLDGALSAAAPAEAERVELHLAACADCRARLQEASRLREEAGALVGMAQPREYVLPSFDAIRARASLAGPMLTTHPRSFLRSPFNDFAWAAMVMLALGLGWMLNDAIDGDDRSVSLERPGMAADAVAESDAEFQVFDIPSLALDTMENTRDFGGEARRMSETGGATAPTEASPVERAQAPAPRLAIPERAFDVVQEEDAYDVVAEEAAAPPLAARFEDADERGVGADGARRRSEPAAGEPLASRAPAAPPPAAQAAAPTGTGAALGALDGEWRAITIAEAERLTERRIVRIAGARVVSSATRGSGSALEVRTVQLTDRSESITVVQRRTPLMDARRREAIAEQAEADMAAADVVTAGLTVRVEDWTVTISGAVAPERLRELAAGLG